MALRTAPLPRMAGQLSFMRSRQASISDLTADSLAVIGVPLEAPDDRTTGARFGPFALRETSVYFGWHANPQFSHPIDVDARVQVDTSSIHERLMDLGDVRLSGGTWDESFEAIATTMKGVSCTGAKVLALGGSECIVNPVVAGLCEGESPAIIQLGGTLRAPEGSRGTNLLIAPARGMTCENVAGVAKNGGKVISARAVSSLNPDQLIQEARALRDRSDALIVHFDISAVSSEWHGMGLMPSYSGLDLQAAQQVLAVLGEADVCGLVVTGLVPTAHGMGIVKTGQRMIVTALLGFIYARLGLSGQTATPPTQH